MKADKLKRITALLLSVLLIACLVPVSSLAEDEDGTPTVRVYFTISDDSEFLTGNDENSRVMARVPIDVPYVDLKDYGLQDFYRYEAEPFEEGGAYKNTVIVEQPTLLMCFLKALSQYYLGREITADDISYSAQYSGEGQSKTMTVNGGPTSLYLLWFWGHFYNFMYFVNHEYPLMAPGWGSTADYIRLEDGDEIDVGMFTDTRFNVYGGFAYFDSGNLEVTARESFDLSLYLTKSKESGGDDYNGPMYKEPIRVSSDYGRTWETKVYTTDRSGSFTASFDEAGVYYLSAGPVFKNQAYSNLQCIAPPICVAEVKPRAVENGKAVKDDAGVRLSWDPSPGADGYTVEYEDASEEARSLDVTGTEAVISDAPDEGAEFSVRPYVTDEYVALGEPARTLYGEAAVIRLGGQGGDEAALAEAKSKAKEELGSYKDLSLYRDAQKKEISGILSRGNAAIDSAADVDSVGRALAAAKAEMDAVKTDAELTREEEAARKEKERRIKAASIKAAKAAKTSVSAKALSKRRARVTWKKVTLSYTVDGKKYTKPVTGYKVYRATKKNGKYKPVKTVKKAGTLKYIDKKLKKGKKYFYKVRTYTVIDGTTYLGKWSKVKSIRAK